LARSIFFKESPSLYRRFSRDCFGHARPPVRIFLPTMPRGRYDNKRAAASGNTTTLAKKAKASPVRGKKVQKGRKTTSKAESSPSLSSSDALMQSFEGLGTRISRADAVSFCSTAVNYASAGGGDDDLFFVKHAKKGEAVMAKLFEALYLGNDGDLSFSSVSFLNMLASRITTDWIYSLVSQLTGVCLLGSIGERLRELEFAKDPSLKRRFEKVKSGAPHSVYLVKLIPLALVTEDSKELAKILEVSERRVYWVGTGLTINEGAHTPSNL